MIYFPENAARAICKIMRDIHIHTQTYPKEKGAEYHKQSARLPDSLRK